MVSAVAFGRLCRHAFFHAWKTQKIVQYRNEQKPYELYRALFGKLLARCQATASGHQFRFKNKLISLDASTIDLCLEIFLWARFRSTKSAVKLYVGLDHGGYLPEFIEIIDGKTTDIEAARRMVFF